MLSGSSNPARPVGSWLYSPINWRSPGGVAAGVWLSSKLRMWFGVAMVWWQIASTNAAVTGSGRTRV